MIKTSPAVRGRPGVIFDDAAAGNLVSIELLDSTHPSAPPTPEPSSARWQGERQRVRNQNSETRGQKGLARGVSTCLLSYIFFDHLEIGDTLDQFSTVLTVQREQIIATFKLPRQELTRIANAA